MDTRRFGVVSTPCRTLLASGTIELGIRISGFKRGRVAVRGPDRRLGSATDLLLQRRPCVGPGRGEDTYTKPIHQVCRAGRHGRPTHSALRWSMVTNTALSPSPVQVVMWVPDMPSSVSGRQRRRGGVVTGRKPTKGARRILVDGSVPGAFYPGWRGETRGSVVA